MNSVVSLVVGAAEPGYRACIAIPSIWPYRRTHRIPAHRSSPPTGRRRPGHPRNPRCSTMPPLPIAALPEPVTVALTVDEYRTAAAREQRARVGEASAHPDEGAVLKRLDHRTGADRVATHRQVSAAAHEKERAGHDGCARERVGSVLTTSAAPLPIVCSEPPDRNIPRAEAPSK